MEEAQKNEKYCPDCGKIFYSAGARCTNCGYRYRQRTCEPHVSLADRLAPYRRRILSLLVLSTLGWGGYRLWRENPDVVPAMIARLRASLLSPPATPRRQIPIALREAPPRRRREGQAVSHIRPDEPPSLVVAPSLIGLTLEEATERAESRGLELVEHRPRALKAGFEEGEVFRQSLAPGKRVLDGSVMFVRVAAGASEPPSSPSPDSELIGDPESDTLETPREEPDELETEKEINK